MDISSHILALSLDIATRPKLYRELAPNPYSTKALRVISEKFPDSNITDIIRAVIRAEPEGVYDWNFNQLSKEQQEEDLSKQKDISAETYKHLVQNVEKYALEFKQLPKEFVYDCLSRIIFETTNIKENEQKYSQKQRREFKLLIIDYIEGIKEENWQSDPHPLNKKNKVRKLKIASIMFFMAVSLFFITDGWQKKIQNNIQTSSEVKEQVLGIEDKENSFEIPLHLNISTPSVDVDTNIQSLGIISNGDMDVPNNINEVGWFSFGPRPGEKGNAVIAGHLNGPNGEEGVFANLDKLKAGDKLFIRDSNGTIITFVVKESRIYDSGYAEEVFSSNDNGVHLNLVTCNGTWDKDKESYNKRLVVFADMLI